MSVAIVKINSRQCVVGSNDERASEQEEIAVPQIYIYICVCVCVCVCAHVYIEATASLLASFRVFPFAVSALFRRHDPLVSETNGLH